MILPVHSTICDLFGVFLILFAGDLRAVNAAQCPSGWNYYQDTDRPTCIFVEDSSKLNWDDAKEICQSLGNADLIKIDSQSKQTFVESLVREDKHYWIGLNDVLQEGVWVWTSDDSPIDYNNWINTEPNNENNEDCGHIRANNNFRWNDAACANKAFYYICEMPADLCPSDVWDYYLAEEVCIFVETSIKKTWHDAQFACQNHQDGAANLVKIEYAEKQEFLESNSRVDANYGNRYWIGLNDEEKEGNFIWTDGAQLTDDSYSNWYPGQPDENFEDCVHLWLNHDYDWNDDECWNSHLYICEISIANGTTVCRKREHLIQKSKGFAQFSLIIN